MKKTLSVAVLAAAMMGGQAFAGFVGDLRASEFSKNPSNIEICERSDPEQRWTNTLIIDDDLDVGGYKLVIGRGAYLDFRTKQDSLCRIMLMDERIYFLIRSGNSMNIILDSTAQNLITAANAPITLIKASPDSMGITFADNDPREIDLRLNNVSYGSNIQFGGSNYTYVAPVASPADLREGQIAFIGFTQDSKEMSILAKAAPPGTNSLPQVPEPATPSLGLLALAALCTRKRRS